MLCQYIQCFIKMTYLQVYSNSTEFAQYNLLFRATMKDDIKRLFRVQNASVWSQYTKYVLLFFIG